MIIYNTSTLNNNNSNKTTFNSENRSELKRPLKRSVRQKTLTTANKNFLKSLNLKLKSK